MASMWGRTCGAEPVTSILYDGGEAATVKVSMLLGQSDLRVASDVYVRLQSNLLRTPRVTWTRCSEKEREQANAYERWSV